MDWEKSDQNMADHLDTLITGYESRKKPMFGAPVYFVNDNMWTGVKGRDLSFNVLTYSLLLKSSGVAHKCYLI